MLFIWKILSGLFLKVFNSPFIMLSSFHLITITLVFYFIFLIGCSKKSLRSASLRKANAQRRRMLLVLWMLERGGYSQRGECFEWGERSGWGECSKQGEHSQGENALDEVNVTMTRTLERGKCSEGANAWIRWTRKWGERSQQSKCSNWWPLALLRNYANEEKKCEFFGV